MKRKNYSRRPKRTTFLRMFTTGMILPILLTIAVWYLGVPISSNYIKNECELQNSADTVNFSQQIEHRSAASATVNKPLEFSLCFSIYRTITTAGMNNIPYLLATTYDDPDSVSAKWAVDKYGNVVLSNRAKMWIVLSENDDIEARRYCSYDPQEFDLPELNELFTQYYKDIKTGKIEYGFDIKSLYLNRENNKMIPHEVEVKRYKLPFIYMDDLNGAKPLDTRTIKVDADAEGFGLVELNDRSDPDSYPRGGFDSIWGADPVLFDEVFEKYNDLPKKAGQNWGMQQVSPEDKKNVYDFYGDREISFDNEYGVTAITSVIRINTMNRHAVRKYVFVTALTFIISALFVLVVCIIRNAKNKAQYAFEDYQRSLINNLAHDLKTPLAVIGGYAENLQELRRDSGSDKEQRYISGIMNNVSYTDDIIAKTLQLSETEQIKKLNKTKVEIDPLVKRLTEKYRAALDERNIELKINVSGEVNADEDVLAAAVENLVSNAVKYTRSDGTISINGDRKRLAIVNDVAENVGTSDLLMPFVKGDKARSDKRSHGLGLAIASSAAAQNGFSLDVSCKDKKFTATIGF